MANLSILLIKNVEVQLRLLGINRSEMARRMDMKPSLLSRYLTGKMIPTLTVLDRMAKALNISPAHLIADDKDFERHSKEDCLNVVAQTVTGRTDAASTPPEAHLTKTNFDKLVEELERRRDEEEKLLRKRAKTRKA